MNSRFVPFCISSIHVNAIRKLSYRIYMYHQDILTTEEVDMMFPEYSFLDNCAQSFGRIEGNLSGISFRKTNTKINVGESKYDVLFSSLNLVKWIWFPMETISVSGSSRSTAIGINYVCQYHG
jgi:hypothetical protein